MLELVAAFALMTQDPPGPPRPPSTSISDYCRSVSARDIAAGGQGLVCGSDEGLGGAVSLERCLTERDAGRHADCRPLLQPEADLVPALLFNSAGETPPARLQGWLDVVCGADRLTAGQTGEACQAEKSALHARAYAARVAMAGRASPANAGRLGFRDPFDTGIDMEGGFSIQGIRTDCTDAERLSFEEAIACDRTARDARSGVSQPGDAEEREADRCQRRESSSRDEDTGDSSASYSINCTWTSGN